jgi:hypothetical protein
LIGFNGSLGHCASESLLLPTCIEKEIEWAALRSLSEIWISPYKSAKVDLSSGPSTRFSKRTLCETARRSEDRLQDYPAVHDERHEETQHAA